MLELSIALPIKVQNGGLFISRGVGRHPARKLTSWEIIFVEKGTLTIQEENTVFEVRAGETLLLWPDRRHVGVGEFPVDLKFYWLHFEIEHYPSSQPNLAIEQHCRVRDAQSVISLFRQFLSEQEKLQRTMALEIILLLILQQISRPSGYEDSANEAGAAMAWKHSLSFAHIHFTAGERAALQRRLPGASISPDVSFNPDGGHSSPACPGGRKITAQRGRIINRSSDTLRF